MSNDLKIWALVIDQADEENICLFWRKKDALEQLPCVIGELCDEEVAQKALDKMPDIEKVFRYLNKASDIEWSLDEVPVEGEIDGAVLKKVQRACKGPREIDEEPEHKAKTKAKADTDCVCLTGVCTPSLKLV